MNSQTPLFSIRSICDCRCGVTFLRASQLPGDTILSKVPDCDICSNFFLISENLHQSLECLCNYETCMFLAKWAWIPAAVGSNPGSVANWQYHFCKSSVLSFLICTKHSTGCAFQTQPHWRINEYLCPTPQPFLTASYWLSLIWASRRTRSNTGTLKGNTAAAWLSGHTPCSRVSRHSKLQDTLLASSDPLSPPPGYHWQDFSGYLAVGCGL